MTTIQLVTLSIVKIQASLALLQINHGVLYYRLIVSYRAITCTIASYQNIAFVLVILLLRNILNNNQHLAAQTRSEYVCAVPSIAPNLHLQNEPNRYHYHPILNVYPLSYHSGELAYHPNYDKQHEYPMPAMHPIHLL